MSDLDALARDCSRALSGWGRSTLQEEAAALADEAARGGELDRYGEGGVVEEVEQALCALLGLEAAVLFPTGTQAQQVALRHWCTRSPRVALHRTAHPLLHEDDALTVVQGLLPVDVGERLSLGAVRAAHDRAPLGAVLLELPHRETGGDLLPFDEVAALSAWCRAEGVALHLDGARLLECGPAYAPRTVAEVAALADSVYLSLYKGLGAPGGAALLGPAPLADDARLWRHRLGGTMVRLWPVALGARRGLREALPRVPVWHAHAVALAAALEAAGVELVRRPTVPLLRVVLPAAPDEAAQAVAAVARERGVWPGRPFAGPRPGTSLVEVTVQERSLEVPPEEGAAVLADVVARLA
ncbi:MAG TPA: aminotransferase class I/II-fold pyridoxal phosphate-dependent enzyme [Mycobacteriales bacterium]|nr:aminotransferase class I/II-fold pyridoxal phosphate-dependent enzyme [Mycobacteriales bacterium]